METLKEAFCRKFSCPPEAFERRFLAAALYPHARLFAFLGGNGAEHFFVDRATVSYCGRLCSLREVEAELREYAKQPENRQFSRETLRIRLSGGRLKRLAEQCLPQN